MRSVEFIELQLQKPFIYRWDVKIPALMFYCQGAKAAIAELT